MYSSSSNVQIWQVFVRLESVQRPQVSARCNLPTGRSFLNFAVYPFYLNVGLMTVGAGDREQYIDQHVSIKRKEQPNLKFNTQ